MLIKKVRLLDREGLFDIRIVDGKFTEIAEDLDVVNDEEIIEGNGALASAPFIEPHIHLDTTLTAGEPEWNKSGTLFEGIERWSQRKEFLTKEDVKTRAKKAIEWQVANGIQFIRTHVDVTDESLIALKAMIEVREEIKDYVTLQIVAFPQEGILSYPNGIQLIEEAIKLGADVIGAIPHFEFTREYGVESINKIFELAKKYSGKNYLKIFFDYPIEDYIRENKRYTIPNIYNKNDYNLKIDDIVYGLPNDNIGLNSKKPYLENKSRKSTIPNLINTEEALIQRKFFDYLMNFATEGKVNVYIGNKVYAKKNGEFPPDDFDGNFLRIKKGKELEIISFDQIVGYKEELLKKVDYKNLLGVKILINEDEVDYGEYGDKKDIQKLISEVFFSKYLINNYFTEASDISLKDNIVKKNLLVAREGIFNWLYKGNSSGINKLLDKVSISLIKGSLEAGYINRANKQFNLRMALKDYFEGGKEMASMMKEIKEKLREKINSTQDDYIGSDEEYCFAVGQLTNYFILQSKAAKKPQFLINSLLNTKNNDVIKLNLKQLYKKYNYKEEMNSLRVRNLYSMILGYELQDNINDDMILAGFLSNSLFYEKKEKGNIVGGNE